MLCVYVDGVAIGMSKDARTPAEYDITAHVTAGQTHELMAVVVRWSDATYIEDQDQWWHAGIPREVLLYSTTLPYLRDVAVTAMPDSIYKGGTLTVKTYANLPGDIRTDWSVSVQVYGPDNKPCFDEPLHAKPKVGRDIMKTMKSKGTYKKGMGLKQVIKEAKKTWKKVKKGGADEEEPVAVEEGAVAPPAVEEGGRRRKRGTRRRKH
jgi:hypothetical protein